MIIHSLYFIVVYKELKVVKNKIDANMLERRLLRKGIPEDGVCPGSSGPEDTSRRYGW